MNRKSKILSRHANGGAVGISASEFYEKSSNPYDACNALGKQEIKDEIEACRVDKSKKSDSYKLWFGKYKDELLHNITDMNYLYYICDVFRNKNKKLVGQALLRIDEYHENLKEEYNKKSYPPVSKRKLRKIRSRK